MKSKKIRLSVLLVFLFSLGLALTSCGNELKIPDEYNYADFSEFITLGDYKGLTYEKTDLQVSRNDIQQYVNDALSEAKETKKLKSGIVESDSLVNISYVGTVDGVEFEGGSSESMDVDIADSNFIEGFAEGLIGRSVGETFDLKVTFPDDYFSEDLAGKPAVFKTTINYIEKSVLPDYNDEFVQNNSDCKTVSEYEEYVKKILLEGKKQENESTIRSDLLQQVLDNTEVVKYPDKELEDSYNDIVDAYKNSAIENADSFEDYIKDNLGVTAEEFYKQCEVSAQETVKTELVLHAIAKLEGIEFSNKDYNDYINSLLENAGMTAEEFEKNSSMTIEEYAVQNNIFSSMLYQNVMSKVIEYSTEK